ncbi:hypothetical protein CPC08DRAFT_769927 [Agrocybe pediades]|nr:hypothetical protein CPC08DRAFT_769927 [Agrocybe pediades]
MQNNPEVDTWRAIPDAQSIVNAQELEIFDFNGSKVKLGSLFQDKKTIIVFIRHFFCGACQLYVQTLFSIPQTAALADANVNIVVVARRPQCAQIVPQIPLL